MRANECDNNEERNGLYWPGDCRATAIIYPVAHKRLIPPFCSQHLLAVRSEVLGKTKISMVFICLCVELPVMTGVCKP